MSQIKISALTFAYEGSYDNVFTNVNLILDTSWRLGLVGRNGRGKTTFLRLLLRELSGSGTISCDVDFEYFPYLHPDKTISCEALLTRICPEAALWELERELSQLGLSAETLERVFYTLSPGERTKALLAAMFLRNNSFLLIDEPTNHLDSEGRALLGDYLRRKSGFILVSHDRALLDACTDHTLSINRANIELMQCSFSTWYADKLMRDEAERQRNDELRGDISRLRQSAERSTRWSMAAEKVKHESGDSGRAGHMAARVMKRAKVYENRMQSAIEEKKALLRNVEEAQSLKLHPLAPPSERLILLRDISLSYGQRSILSHLSLEISHGERLALRGHNGCGKTSLLRIITGELAPSEGTVQRNGRLIVSYMPQDTSSLHGPLREYPYRQGLDETLFLTLLRKLDFPRVQFEKDMEALSAGQRKKVLIAASLATAAHIYIWDEPLNYIDVYSRMQIEQLIKEYHPTMLFVEHDEAFCKNIATRSIYL